MKHRMPIAVNDIVTPVRIEVNSKEQLLSVIQAAVHVQDALEIHLKGTHFTYYICAMEGTNQLFRRRVLKYAVKVLKKLPAEQFLDKILRDPGIPENVLIGRVG